MKKLVLITAIFSQILFAQQNDLTLEMTPVTGSAVNWEATLTLNASGGIENGFFIEVPAGVKMAPLSARINQNDLFLQNLNEIPSGESIICWTLLPEGLVFFFRDGQFNPGDQIVVTTMTTQVKKTLEANPAVNIRSIQKNESTIQYSEDIKSSANLSLKIEN